MSSTLVIWRGFRMCVSFRRNPIQLKVTKLQVYLGENCKKIGLSHNSRANPKSPKDTLSFIAFFTGFSEFFFRFLLENNYNIV
jgi:hypothetical protein